MKHLDGILKLVDTEFGAIEENGKFRSREEIDSVYKLMDIAKDIYCVWKYEDEMENGYSENYGYGYDGGMSNNSYRGRSYDGGYSNARGRGSGAKRYANGQYAPYSRDGGMSNRGMSYRGRGYSMDDGKEEYLENLREMMQSAPDENTRQSIQRMIQQMEQ
jgi:hypothetical protein